MRNSLKIALALCAVAAPAHAQVANRFAVTVAPNYRAFSLDESLAASSVSLLLLPVAVTVPLGNGFAVDAYTAYARGSVEMEDETLQLSGPIDTQLRGMWAARPWALLTVGVNVPTGKATHSTEEAIVAASLSTDLLGFREASFGTGLGITTGVALAHQLGEWGIGYGGSYRINGEFEPSEDTSLVYAPGDQIVARVALDRNVGVGGRLTFGGLYQHFADDEIGESNLFAPGARVRGDASYAFRAGATTTMQLFLADLWRQQGELSLVGDSDATQEVGAQNVLIVGAAANFGGALRLSPRADVRLLSHEEGTGSGWLAGVGTGIETGLGGVDLSPRVRVMLGSLEDAEGEGRGLSGFELELVARF